MSTYFAEQYYGSGALGSYGSAKLYPPFMTKENTEKAGLNIYFSLREIFEKYLMISVSIILQKLPLYSSNQNFDFTILFTFLCMSFSGYLYVSKNAVDHDHLVKPPGTTTGSLEVVNCKPIENLQQTKQMG